MEEAAVHLNCHNSKISRIELAQRSCAKKDFEALMDLYEVEDARRAELRELMIRGRQRLPPWWHAYSDVISANYSEFLAYEAEAAWCQEYQSLLIPGLLQTAGYARAVTHRGFNAVAPDQIDTFVEVRMRRQERLRDEQSLLLDALIMEASLHLQVGGAAVMYAQLEHLQTVSELDNVSLRIIPFEVGERGASTGVFTLFATEPGQHADVAFTESADINTVFRDNPLTVRKLRRLFDNLSEAALPEQNSHELLDCLKRKLTKDA